MDQCSFGRGRQNISWKNDRESDSDIWAEEFGKRTPSLVMELATQQQNVDLRLGAGRFPASVVYIKNTDE